MAKRGRAPHADLLTPAEWRVVEAVRHGMGNREIAARRGISTDAVKYHLANALQKLGLGNCAELQRWNGVAQNSALFSKDVQMGEALQMGPLGQIARRVRDIRAARQRYGKVLVWPIFIPLAILPSLIAVERGCFFPRTTTPDRVSPFCISGCPTFAPPMRTWLCVEQNSSMRRIWSIVMTMAPKSGWPSSRTMRAVPWRSWRRSRDKRPLSSLPNPLSRVLRAAAHPTLRTTSVPSGSAGMSFSRPNSFSLR
jgi:DNA-binding CsgD family transcriptional regulator